MEVGTVQRRSRVPSLCGNGGGLSGWDADDERSGCGWCRTSNRVRKRAGRVIGGRKRCMCVCPREKGRRGGVCVCDMMACRNTVAEACIQMHTHAAAHACTHMHTSATHDTIHVCSHAGMASLPVYQMQDPDPRT
eukprot:3625803-Rhodomonas_salina.1